MKSRRQITRSDVAVFLVVALFLLGNVAAIGTAGRERAKRTICLSNLKQLTQAWRQFADDHDGQLVNGMAGILRMSKGQLDKPWVGKCWADNYAAGKHLDEDIQREEIQDGALWPYLQELNLYRCPSGYAGEMLNYTIADGMNGLTRIGTTYGGKSVRVGDTVLWIRNFDEIITPGPDKRMVFIDEGWITPDSFNTHYTLEAWWDDPPIRHNDGTTVSFADGHTEYWQWKGADTIEYGRRSDGVHMGGSRTPQTAEGREDLHRLQRAVWGRLGYEPTGE
jgi:prepilin-type processing-associated H-X9-DG protein